MTYISNTFPTAIQTGTDPIGTDGMSTFDHAGLESFQNDSILSLKNKVGIDSSAVNTSHDYKLSGVSTGDKAVSKTGTETLTNKTLTSPIITNASSTGTNSGNETLTNKTLTSPTINSASITGTITGTKTDNGTNTFGGSNTFTSLPQSSATPSTGNDLTNKTYVDGKTFPDSVLYGDGSDGAVTISSNTT